MRAGAWSTDDDAALRRVNGTMPYADIALQIGRTVNAVRNRVWHLRIGTRDDAWTDAEVKQLRAAYENAVYSPDINLSELAMRLSRNKANVCRKARSLGLTNNSRKAVAQWKDRRKYKTPEELRAAQSERQKRQIAERGHPRGMAGKKHNNATQQRISETSTAWQRSTSPERKAEIVLKAMKTKVERYGRVGGLRPHTTWKAGWREIGGKRNYYRSRWEANYARYLQWLKERGDLRDWAHEPETFWFEAIKRGVRSYLPDFRVWENDGTSRLHEVKGWMDARSKTTIKRMAKYHPGETLLVINEKAYNEIARKIGPMVEGWESGGRKDRP